MSAVVNCPGSGLLAQVDKNCWVWCNYCKARWSQAGFPFSQRQIPEHTPLGPAPPGAASKAPEIEAPGTPASLAAAAAPTAPPLPMVGAEPAPTIARSQKVSPTAAIRDCADRSDRMAQFHESAAKTARAQAQVLRRAADDLDVALAVSDELAAPVAHLEQPRAAGGAS